MKSRVKHLVRAATRKRLAKPQYPAWNTLLEESPGIAKDAKHRISMTISCHDCDEIPKVKDAGKIKTLSGKKYQVMHNGLLVEKGGYFGDWMSEIITTLKGHHEPQEEKVFHEILKVLPDSATMIELGAYWAYYSLWFNKFVKNPTNYCCEPDPKNIALGERNARINNAKNIQFIYAAAGKDDKRVISFKPQEGDYPPVRVPIRSVDGIVTEHGIEKLDILHMDIQGAELSALEGAEDSIRKGLVRFVIVSTHHYLVSADVLTHEKCIEKIKELGGHIIVEHAVHESFSGDGLIVASFDDSDKDMSLTVSENRMQDSLFRSYNEDMAILAEAYERLRKS